MGPHDQRVPSQGQLPKATISPSHSHPNLEPRPANMKAARQSGQREVAPAVPFLNLDPTSCLVGQSNEAHIIVDGQKVIMLNDSGVQVSTNKLRVLQADGPEGPPSRQATETRGYQQSHHPILGIC